MVVFWANKKGGAKSGSGKKNKSVSNFMKFNKKRERIGRPNCLDDEKRDRLLNLYLTHPYSFRDLAEMFSVSRMTVWRTINGMNKSVMR